MNTLKKYSTEIACGILALGVVFLGFGLKITFQKADAATVVFFNQGGTSTTSAQTQGIFFFNGTAGHYAQNTGPNGLIWDFSTNRLGIASTTPGSVLSIGADAAGINFVANGTSTFTAGVRVGTGGLQSSAGLTITGGSVNCTTCIPNASLANSTISGISLGGDLANLTATDGTLTFSGTYTGATARTIGLNLGNANTWTALQTLGNLYVTASSTISGSYFANGNINLAGLITASSTATSTLLGGLNIGVNPNGTKSGGGFGISTTSTNNGLSVDGPVSLCETRITPSGTPTVNWSNCPKQVMTMTANVTAITFVQGKAGTAYRLSLCQDATGGRTIRGWGSGILFVTGSLSNSTTTPGHTTKANTCNVFTFDVSSGTSTIIYQGTLPLMTY